MRRGRAVGEPYTHHHFPKRASQACDLSRAVEIASPFL
jgi:hypothetical protein